MYDPKTHKIDPATGFMVDRETGVPAGLVPRPHLPVSDERDYPKWVVVHDSHVVRQKMDGYPEHVSTPSYVNSHVNRLNGEVTVMVANEDEEKAAVGERKEEKVSAAGPDADILDEVRRDLRKHKAAQAANAARAEAEEEERMVADEANVRMAARLEAKAREREAADKIVADERARTDKLAASESYKVLAPASEPYRAPAADPAADEQARANEAAPAALVAEPRHVAQTAPPAPQA
jgi:hypothetical protein